MLKNWRGSLKSGTRKIAPSFLSLDARSPVPTPMKWYPNLRAACKSQISIPTYATESNDAFPDVETIRFRARVIISSRDDASLPVAMGIPLKSRPARVSFRSADSRHAPVANAMATFGRAANSVNISLAPGIAWKLSEAFDSPRCIR